MLRLNLSDFVKFYEDGEIKIKESTPLPPSFDGQVFINCDVSPDLHCLILSTMFFLDFIRNNLEGNYTIDLFFKYLPYSRQDRITDENKVLTSQIVVEMLYDMGAHRIVTLDVHNPKLYSCYGDRFVSVSCIPFLIKKAEELDGFDKSWVIVYPDIGAFERFSGYFDGFDYITLSKKREMGNVSINSAVVSGGDISAFSGRNFAFVDDVASSGRSISVANEYLKSCGCFEESFEKLFLFIPHMVGVVPIFPYFRRLYTCGNKSHQGNYGPIVMYNIENHIDEILNSI